MNRFRISPDGPVAFGPFRIDPDRGRLLCGDELVHLRPKTWDVLCLLAANPGLLLTKQDIITAVWGDVAVGDTMPSISVTELRRALEDDAKSPRYIETVHGRGFRFIAELRRAESESRSPAAAAVDATPFFVGRSDALGALEESLSVRDPRCRVFLISGEAGIGKTTLVEQFIAALRDDSSAANHRARAVRSGGASPRWLVGRGQCQAHFGQGYPYLPVLGALRSMCEVRADTLPRLRSVAPGWLARLPDLVPSEEVEALRRRTEGTTQSRAIEEMFALLSALGPVVWVLEDLHWADEATLELVSLVAENLTLAHFHVLGTIRLGDAVASAHGSVKLRRELRRRGRCREIMLEGLAETDVDRYLRARFPSMHAPVSLSQRLLTRTNGNPFFLVHTVDHLVDAGAIVPEGSWTASQQRDLQRALDAVPATLRELVQEELSTLSDTERRLLEAASLAGLECDAATTALALEAPVDRIDAACTELVRRTGLLTRIGETIWPNGVASGRYAFRHALYQKVLYDDQPPATRGEAHGRIGHGLAGAFAGRESEVAAIVADHFERGRDAERAVRYHRLAARDSGRRHASHEAALHLRRALELLPGLPGGAVQEEASILAELGQVLPAVEGFGDPDLLELYLRARRLQATGDDATSEFMTMAGLLLANLMQRRPEPAEALSRELVEMTANHTDPASRVIVEMTRGAILYHRGDLVGTIEHADRSLALDLTGVTLGPINQRCTALMMSGAALWQAGQLDEGLARAEQALAIARSGANPFNIVLALQPLAAIHQWRGDAASARRVTDELGVLVSQQGIAQAEACSELIQAWALLESGEREVAERRLERGLAALRAHGTMMQTVYLLAVAVEVLIGLERAEEARAVLGEAQARIEDGDARWWEPELHRWRGVLAAAGGDDPREVEGCLKRALEIAAMQGSEALRLRGAISLAQIAERSGESLLHLAEALKRVSGGVDTRDVVLARRLLEEGDVSPGR